MRFFIVYVYIIVGRRFSQIFNVEFDFWWRTYVVGVFGRSVFEMFLTNNRKNIKQNQKIISIIGI